MFQIVQMCTLNDNIIFRIVIQNVLHSAYKGQQFTSLCLILSPFRGSNKGKSIGLNLGDRVVKKIIKFVLI